MNQEELDILKEIQKNIAVEEYVCQVKNQQGLGIIAHPFESRAHFDQYPPYPWTLWESDCFDGIEIWNQMSEWMEGLTARNKYLRALHPRRSILAPKRETLAKWDELNRVRKVVGVGGVDAHGHIHKLWGFIPKRIFRYKISFRTIRTYVLLKEELSREDHEQDLRKIYSALRSANCFVAHRYFGDASGFRFYAQNKSGGRAAMGESLAFREDSELIVNSPMSATVRLIGNGSLLEEKKGRRVVFKASNKGVYRVEVWHKNRLWILSNHIRFV